MDKHAEKNITDTISAVYGCKWSLRILRQISSGTNRPGAIEKALPGLTKRVQSYYLTRMIELEVLEKQSFPEIPPRVEYSITEYGKRILKIMDEIIQLESDLRSNQSR